MSWWLENAERLAHQNGVSIPPRAERDNLAVGQLVQLHVASSKKKSGHISEGAWVEVTDVGENAYRGQLTKASSAVKALKKGVSIDFLALHVVAIRSAS